MNPPDMPSALLWAKLQEKPRPKVVVDFPRKGDDGKPLGQLAIRILTQEEKMACEAEAEKFARKLLKDSNRDAIGYHELYQDALCVEMLVRACRDVDNDNLPVFPSAALLREKLTTVECAVLFEHYMTAQLELGPLASRMTKEECDAWIDKLVEGGSTFPFDLLSSDLQKILVLSMARRLASSPTDRSSAGSPPDETPPSDDGEPTEESADEVAGDPRDGA